MNKYTVKKQALKIILIFIQEEFFASTEQVFKSATEFYALLNDSMSNEANEDLLSIDYCVDFSKSFQQVFNVKSEDFFILKNQQIEFIGEQGLFGFDRAKWKKAQQWLESMQL